MSDTPCTSHGGRISDMERRVTFLEAMIGISGGDGLRGLISKLSEQLGTLIENVQALQLAQAKASGAIEGASWVGRIVWLVLGGAVTAAVLQLFRG